MKYRNIYICLFCFIIGLLLVTQFGVTEGQSVYFSPKVAGEYKTSINSEKSEIENIRSRIRETEEQLTKYENAIDEESIYEITDELAAEVMKYKMFSGYEAVQGSGVTIVVDDGTRQLYDGEDVNVLLVHDIDIIIIINDLKRSGAEAVSVNGQRIVDRTEIVCSGYTVRINGQILARPFVIKAIGDGKRMSASLISSEGYGSLLKTYGVQFDVELEDDVFIQRYAGTEKYYYMINAKEV